MIEHESKLDTAFLTMKRAVYDHRYVIIGAMLFGLLAHNFAFTNKLLNADETAALYSKGADVASGRWGIRALSFLFPNYSMPWLWGIVSLLLLTIAACMTVEIFQIKNPLLQILLSGLITTFPSETGTFCFMFTAPVYAFALFLAVFGVYVACGTLKYRFPLSGVLLLIATTIYQAYIMVAASFFLLHILHQLLEDKKSANALFREALSYVLLMIAALLGYYLTVQISVAAEQTELLSYAFSENSILRRFIMIYTSFFGILFRGYFGFVNSTVSQISHVLLLLLMTYAVLYWMYQKHESGKKRLLILLLFLFPVSVNGIYLIANIGVIHTLVLYSAVSLYLLAIILGDIFLQKKKNICGDVLKLCLALILCSNILFANKVYLKEYLQYENAYSLYSSVITQIKSTDGFNESSVVALIGSTDTALYRVDEIDTSNFTPVPVSEDLVNIYTRECLVKYYLGFDVLFASDFEKRQIKETEEFQNMPCYPYYGSVQKIGDFIVVKFS